MPKYLVTMNEREICLEEYQEGHLELHRETCVLRLVFRCTICHEDYVSREGLWNHLDWHEILDEDKELNYQEMKAKHKLLQCSLCNDQRCFSETSYWMHIQTIHGDYGVQHHALDSDFSRVVEEPSEEENKFNLIGATVTALENQEQSTVDHSNPRSNPLQDNFLEMEIKVEKTELKEQDNEIPNEQSEKAKKSNKSSKQQNKLKHPKKDSSKTTQLVRRPLWNRKSKEEKEEANRNGTAYRRRAPKIPESASCPVCGIFFPNKTNLYYHRITQHEEARFECPYCSKKIYTKRKYRIHTGCCEKYKFKCSICAQKFMKAISLEMHLKSTHVANILSGDDALVEYKHPHKSEPKNMETRGTEFAQEEIEDKKGKLKSPPVHRIESVVRYEAGKKVYWCAICGLTYPNYGMLWRHRVVSHTKPRRRCSFCDKLYYFSTDLRRHAETCSASYKPLKCSVCGIRVKDEVRMEWHRIVRHTEPQHKCRFCSKGFHVLRYLNRHQRLCPEAKITRQQTKAGLRHKAEAYQDDGNRISKPKVDDVGITAEIRRLIQRWITRKKISKPDSPVEVNVAQYNKAFAKCWVCSRSLAVTSMCFYEDKLYWNIVNFGRHILSHMPSTKIEDKQSER